MCANKHSDNWLTCTCLCWPCLTDSSVSRRKHIKHTCTLVLHNMCNNIEHTGSNAIQTWLLNSICFDISNFRHCLTFFSKSFSHFPHGTCTLSVSNQYLALDEVYHPICAPLPRNATLGSTPCMKDCTWHAGVSPSLLLSSKRLACTLSLAMHLYYANLNQRFRLSTWAIPCSFAITKGILFSLLSSAYLYA